MARTTAAQAAAAIRKELKQAFPNVVFSVRSSNFAGGDAVDIRYENAMPVAQVDAIVHKYQSGHFDGSTDMYEYDNSRNDIPQAKYVHVQRDITPDKREEVKRELAAKFNVKDINDENEWYKTFRCWSDQAIWQELKDRTF